MKMIFSCMVTGILIISLFTAYSDVMISPSTAEASVPEYAKWGNLAVLEAKKHYNASITEYQHLGRTVLTDQMAEERFRLIVKKDGTEFPVTVIVKFNSSSNELIDVQFSE
ncbi:DUF3889 domain-containing protein [Paenibacillus sp. 453mf]|uniref:DUF3889 domain-containing protein n=1 Tax=Paenibacillus sp. 453mf TaxID=1761874 RepID=UPI0008F14D99|nr:DUF3889 domain-containing protein [Paenibacillus sp. 453mf]SFS58824.1 Protein of unknown function [Paenibacillus sp. 453mf]